MKGRKTSLQTIATGLFVVAMERLTAGHLYQGGAAAIVAIGLWYAYEEYGAMQLPTSADDIAGLTDQIGSTVEDRVGQVRDDLESRRN